MANLTKKKSQSFRSTITFFSAIIFEYFKFGPGERTPIFNYHPNHYDVIGRSCLLNGP